MEGVVIEGKIQYTNSRGQCTFQATSFFFFFAMSKVGGMTWRVDIAREVTFKRARTRDVGVEERFIFGGSIFVEKKSARYQQFK